MQTIALPEVVPVSLPGLLSGRAAAAAQSAAQSAAGVAAGRVGAGDPGAVHGHGRQHERGQVQREYLAELHQAAQGVGASKSET